MPRAGQPVPADFTALAPKHTTTALAVRYGVSCTVVKRWRRIVGIATPSPVTGPRPVLSVPDDFTRYAPGHSRNRTAEHYGVDRSVVARWERETGVTCNTSPRRPDFGSLEARNRSQSVQAVTRKLRVPPPKLGDLEDQAADHLRRFTPVYRCDERGRMCVDGSLWRFGNALLSGAEVVERALAKGFDPNWWKGSSGRAPLASAQPASRLPTCFGPAE